MNAFEALSNGMAVLRARWYLRSASRRGARVRVWGRPTVSVQGGQLIIGDRARFVSTVAGLELGVGGGLLSIGEGAFINYGCTITAELRVVIGPGCNIGSYCYIVDTDIDTTAPGRLAAAPIVLEENVWLGARVIVLPGVTIGANSVIGAGSVVAEDIQSRSLAVGMPARVLKQL